MNEEETTHRLKIEVYFGVRSVVSMSPTMFFIGDDKEQMKSFRVSTNNNSSGTIYPSAISLTKMNEALFVSRSIG